MATSTDAPWAIPSHFLFRAASGKTVPPGPRRCCLCGCSCAEVVPVGAVIRDTFTNHGLCRVPHSPDVCRACDHLFNHRWECGQKYHSEYRKHSHLVTAHAWRSWRRADMRADLERFLRDGCPECLLVVALSKKKHCLPLARVNPPGASFAVQVEEEQVQVSPGTWFPLAAAFDRLRELGMTKGNILSGNYFHAALRRAPLAEVLRWNKVIAPWRPSGLLTLVSYVTLLEDDDDEPGRAAGD